jgi:glutamate--cysteine ligase catalytic subunit
VCIDVPIFRDSHTPKNLEVASIDMTFPSGLPETPDWKADTIHMDAMGFGMGCCCLQITFQAPELHQARRLYDQLTVLCPIIVLKG